MNTTMSFEGALPSFSELLVDNPGWLDEAVSTADVTRMTGVPAATLATLRTRGGGPDFFKIGTSVRYRRRAIFDWLDTRQAQRRNSRAPSPAGRSVKGDASAAPRQRPSGP